MKLSYALDTFKEGRAVLAKKDGELLSIWDKLQNLVDNGKIKYYLDGDDEIKNPVPIFTFSSGDVKLIESTVEEGCRCYPNVTANGLLIYDNTFFATKEEAISKMIKNYESYIEYDKDRIRDRELDLQTAKDIMDRDSKRLINLREMMEQK